MSDTTVAPPSIVNTPPPVLPVPSGLTPAASAIVPVPVATCANGATVRSPAAVTSRGALAVRTSPGSGAQPAQVDAPGRRAGGADANARRRVRGVEQDAVAAGADAAGGVEGDLAGAGQGRGGVPAGGDDAAGAGTEMDVAAAGGQGGAGGAVQDDGARAGGRLEGGDAGAGGGGVAAAKVMCRSGWGRRR